LAAGAAGAAAGAAGAAASAAGAAGAAGASAAGAGAGATTGAGASTGASFLPQAARAKAATIAAKTSDLFIFDTLINRGKQFFEEANQYSQPLLCLGRRIRALPTQLRSVFVFTPGCKELKHNTPRILRFLVFIQN
jgi:hypothetical protein